MVVCIGELEVSRWNRSTCLFPLKIVTAPFDANSSCNSLSTIAHQSSTSRCPKAPPSTPSALPWAHTSSVRFGGPDSVV